MAPSVDRRTLPRDAARDRSGAGVGVGRLAELGARVRAAPAAHGLAGGRLDAVRAGGVAPVADRLAGTAPADPDAAVHRHRRAPAGPALELALPRDVGRLPSLVAGSRRRPGTARPCGGRGRASPSHAGAGPGTRSAGGAGRRRRYGRIDADPVEPATVHRSLLPGGR